MNITNAFPLIAGLFSNSEPEESYIGTALAAIVTLGAGIAAAHVAILILGAGIALYDASASGRPHREFRHGLTEWCNKARNEEEQVNCRIAADRILDAYISGRTVLDLSHLDLFFLPSEIEELESLEHLDLSHNNFTASPNLFPYRALKTLNLSNCQLSEPPDLSHNLRLENLNLQNNQLKKLSDLSQHKKLEFVRLTNNQLSTFPDLSQNFPRYGVNIEDNLLTVFPQWIISLHCRYSVFAGVNCFSATYLEIFRELVRLNSQQNPNQGPHILALPSEQPRPVMMRHFPRVIQRCCISPSTRV